MTDNKKKDSFVFKREFFDALQNMHLSSDDNEDVLGMFIDICEYFLNGVEPKCCGKYKAIFELIKALGEQKNNKFTI